MTDTTTQKGVALFALHHSGPTVTGRLLTLVEQLSGPGTMRSAEAAALIGISRQGMDHRLDRGLMPFEQTETGKLVRRRDAYLVLLRDAIDTYLLSHGRQGKVAVPWSDKPEYRNSWIEKEQTNGEGAEPEPASAVG